ncbi:hypothetical protein TNCV_2011161 [Trichonephila clavipes]|nr:hypothetical protein TNCV_2011161 [Trichonephila clavipes]
MKKKEISTAADSVRSGWPLWDRLWSRHPIESLNESTQSSRAGAASPKCSMCENFGYGVGEVDSSDFNHKWCGYSRNV